MASTRVKGAAAHFYLGHAGADVPILYKGFGENEFKVPLYLPGRFTQISKFDCPDPMGFHIKIDHLILTLGAV